MTTRPPRSTRTDTLVPYATRFRSFVARRSESVEGLGLEITVLGEDEMRDLGMGALLGANQGSRREPRLLALKWSGDGAGNPALALVGQGVALDTGGLQLKTAAAAADRHGVMGGEGSDGRR